MDKKIKTYVSEPWDFEGPDGKNIIIGKILIEVDEKCVIFEADKEQKFVGGSGKLFVFAARYVGEKLVINNSSGHKIYVGTFGAGLLSPDNYYGKDKKYIIENSKYVFIGSFA